MRKILAIILCLIILCSFVGCTGIDSNNPPVTQTTPKAVQSPIPKDNYLKKAGEYIVGKDIDAGTYLLIGEKNAIFGGSYQVTLSANAEILSDDFLYNNIFSNRHYITVNDGEYLSFSRCKLYEVDNAPKIDFNSEEFEEGQYLVGSDIPVGSYNLIVTSNNYIGGSVKITTTPNADIMSKEFISIDIFETNKYVDLKAGQYIYFGDAKLTKIA